METKQETNPVKYEIECPLCGEKHTVCEKTRKSVAFVKETQVNYRSKYCVCENCNEGENEFIPAKMMDANLSEARNQYRKKRGLLTSSDIVELREHYGLTQRELARMLGWGDATIARYESKFIQDETHDEILRTIRRNAFEARQYLVRNKDKFTKKRYKEILASVEEEISRTSQHFLTIQKLEAEYLAFQSKPELTGKKRLDIDKVRLMVAFFATHCMPLFKVKLMKLLWYSDALFYKENGCSMSGLVYQHMPMGALPVGNSGIMELVPYEEIYNEQEDYVSYKILPSVNFKESVFSEKELCVLRKVLDKFHDFSGAAMSAYMHEEAAYQQTAERAYIPYPLAEKIEL
ncbi:DUF4065 domain-containing protein [bacterium]|nr:DUF4065 domain-containing protein [bacterium]